MCATVQCSRLSSQKWGDKYLFLLQTDLSTVEKSNIKYIVLFTGPMNSQLCCVMLLLGPCFLCIRKLTLMPLNNLQEVLALLLILCQNLIVVLDLCYSTFSEVFDGSNPAYNLFDDWKEASFSHSEGFFAKKSHYEYCKMLYLAYKNYKIPSVESCQ